MNRRNLILTGLAAMLALCNGCAVFQQIAGNPDSLKADVQDIVRVGTKLYLVEHPDRRPAFELAYTNLSILITNKQVTGGTLVEILNTLPLKQFQGDKGQLILELGQIVFNRLAGSKLDLAKAPYVQAAAEGAQAGLGQALGK